MICGLKAKRQCCCRRTYLFVAINCSHTVNCCTALILKVQGASFNIKKLSCIQGTEELKDFVLFCIVSVLLIICLLISLAYEECLGIY